MNIITCPTCGQQYDASTTNTCPYCGAPTPTQQSTPNQQETIQQPQYQYQQPIPNYAQPQPYPYYQYPVKKKHSGMGIASFILAFFWLLSPVGLILAIIDLVKKDPNKKHGFSIAGCVMNGIGVLLLIIAIAGMSSTDKNTNTNSSTPLVTEKEDSKEESSIATKPEKEESSIKEELSTTEESSQTVEESSQAVEESSQTSLTTNGYILSDYTIVDNDYCVMKISSVEEDSFWHTVTFKVYCENKTADKTLIFTTDDTLVNNWSIYGWLYEQVAPGKKSNAEWTFSGDSLNECGIKMIDVLWAEYRVYDSDDWSADDYANGVFTIYPTGLDETTVQLPVYDYSKAQNVVVDDGNMVFAILGTRTDSIWGYCVDVYILNKTDKTLMYSWDDVSVNGFMIDPYFATSIAPNGQAFNTINFYTEDLEANSITDVEDIEYKMTVYDYDDWFASHLIEQVFTFEP